MQALEHYVVQTNNTCSAVLTKFTLIDDEDLQGTVLASRKECVQAGAIFALQATVCHPCPPQLFNATGMHAEQYKLLDTLILLEAQGVVTHYKSLGGLFLNEYRHMLFKGQRAMTRVQTQVCGEDAVCLQPRCHHCVSKLPPPLTTRSSWIACPASLTA